MMLVQKGFQERSLLALAAFNGDKDIFEAILTAMGTRLDTQKVRNRYLVCDAAHFRLKFRPSLTSWRIAGFLISNTVPLNDLTIL